MQILRKKEKKKTKCYLFKMARRKILCFGDSLFENLPMEDSLEFEYHIECFPVKLAKDMHADLNIALKESKYDVVVLCAGVNDLGHGLLPQDVVNSLLELHNICSQHQCDVIAVNLHSPMFELFNELYDEQSDANMQFCTFFYHAKVNDFDSDDNIHLSAEGKDHFATCIHEIIEGSHKKKHHNKKRKFKQQNVTKEDTLYTYIFPRVWTDYTTGVAIARASSKENAIQMLLKEFDVAQKRDENTKMLASCTGTGTYTKLGFEKELRQACAVMNDAVPFAFFVAGGS